MGMKIPGRSKGNILLVNYLFPGETGKFKCKE